MKEFSITMALIDFIPVILFSIGAITLQRELYNKMSKGAFAIFSAGTINVIFAGFTKALYKLLYAGNACDFQPLNNIFFPVQSIGFLLAGIGIMAMLYWNQGRNTLYAAAPPVFMGTFIFVGCMCFGLGMLYYGLCILSVKLRKPFLIISFVISFLLMLGMGYLSSKDFSQAYFNWIAQGINIIAQGLSLYGIVALKESGLATLDLNAKAEASDNLIFTEEGI